MQDSSLPVIASIIAALSAHADVTALVGDRIYSEAPDSASYPLILIDSVLSNPAIETQGGEGWELLVTLHVWSRSPVGPVECHQVVAAVVDALHDTRPALSEGGVVMMRVISTRVSKRNDGETTQGVIRLRVMTDQ
ncbi:MAG: DUF3168 domain-containing protein [Pseudomonadota bacterium]